MGISILEVEYGWDEAYDDQTVYEVEEGEEDDDEARRLEEDACLLASLDAERAEADERQDVDLATYAKYILKDGTNEERRELLGCFKSRIRVTKRVVTVDQA